MSYQSKINAKDVTLVCADDVGTQDAFALLTTVCEKMDFGAVKLFSSNVLNRNVTEIKPLNNIQDYDNFIYHNLNEYVETDFCMIVQTDGCPVNYKAWTDNFLKYHYIGSPWVWNPHIPLHQTVGNSGFSIRSKKLMEALSKYKYDSNEDGPEDEYICQTIDFFLKENDKLDFAPFEVARAFSVENTLYTGSFGYHGKKTHEMNAAVGVHLPPQAD